MSDYYLCLGGQMFSLKGQRVNVRLCGPHGLYPSMVLVGQPYVDDWYMNGCGCVPMKLYVYLFFLNNHLKMQNPPFLCGLYKNKQWARFGPRDTVC